MSTNIVEVYSDQERYVREFNRTSEDWPMKMFDSCEMSAPTVMNDGLARKWLEVNYLFSTGFYSGQRPGIGEIGADITTIKQLGQKKLTVNVMLLDSVVRALHDYRPIEPVVEEWQGLREQYLVEVKRLEEIAGNSESNKNLFENFYQHVGWSNTGLPSTEFIKGLKDLREGLERIATSVSDKGIKIARRLESELVKYTKPVNTLQGIRKYHKGYPRISEDGLLRILTPAASGGICMHTHPGYDEPINCMPSGNDLMILAAQSGAIPIVHIGGGETEGELYIMHVPRKIFFEEVRGIVDSQGLIDDQEIGKVKDQVFQKRYEELTSDEILGFNFYSSQNRSRKALISPLVSQTEFDKHQDHFYQRGFSPVQFVADDLLLDVGQGYALYDSQNKEITMKNIGNLSKGGKEE